MYQYLKPLIGSICLVGLLSLVHVASALFVPTMTADIINLGVLRGDIDVIGSLSISMLLASFFTVVASLAAVYMSSHIAARISFAMRQDLVEALQAFSLTDFAKFGTGTMLMRTTRDVEKIQSVLSEGINLILPMPIMLIGGLSLTFYKSTELGFVILALIIIMVSLMGAIQKRALPIVKAVQLQLDAITDLVRDHILGMAVIRAFNRSDDEHTNEVAAFSDMADKSIRLSRTYAIGLPSILIIFNLSTVVILWVGGYNVSDGVLQIGDIMAVIEYATLILLNLLMAVFVLLDVPEAMICFQRIQEILKYESPEQKRIEPVEGSENSDNTEKPNIENPNTKKSNTDIKNMPVMEFKQVTFRYDNAEEPALEDVSFALHKGEHLAIMGDIGSGKSTIAKLMLALFPIEKGQILFKGQSIYDMPVETLRSQIGYVPQKAYLFTGSIAMNVAYGAATDISSLDLNVSREQIERACRLAGADEFIAQLPNTYDYELTQGGTNVSGGQRQRLAMARALVREPEVLIFDDSFSALDGTTEQLVRRAIDEELQKNPDRTFISVEQKVSAARKADAILVINQGRAVGFGTHDELVAQCPIYKQIVASQEVAL
ncbi:ABC transporter ATP-binding protein [Veillonella sp.]|uniref:ABC transporter ATP-binding protein n=1 Tax=Veillonella sp. TaxID=1926307 RepID=UPI0025CD6C08|nr:ABC transporter ATP-binding protein [Veillonella sp.]